MTVDASNLRTWLAEQEISCVRLLAVNPDGIVMGKYLRPEKFLSIATSGTPLADIGIAGFDLSGGLGLGWDFGAWRGDIADINVLPDLDTLVRDPGPYRWASVLCDITSVDGEPLPVCYRGLLRRLTGRLRELGYEAKVAAELEFTVFRESIHEAREAGYDGLSPLGGPVALPYLTSRTRDVADFMECVVRKLEALSIPWESWLNETVPGQVELNVAPADPVRAADHVTMARIALREAAEEQGVSITFMASLEPGSFGTGMHINQSLLDAHGDNVFFDPASSDHRSETMRHWVGGLLETLPGAASLFMPTVNSYRRLVELAGPPTTVSWGEDNKSVAVRTISRDPKTTRIEHRVASADCNVYLATSALLAGGILGLERQIEPPEPVRSMAWFLPDGSCPRLPDSLAAAVDALRREKRLQPLLGADMLSHWLGCREWEWRSFHAGGGDPDAVTEFERRRYFEQA